MMIVNRAMGTKIPMRSLVSTASPLLTDTTPGRCDECLLIETFGSLSSYATSF